MLDLSHIANAANGADIQIFNALGAIDWQTWMRPRGKSMFMALMLGGGAGGGGGFSGVAASARGGGGGGAGCNITKYICPMLNIPDNLFVNVALGGAGGGAGATGSSPTNGYVSLQPNNTVSNLYLQSFLVAPSGGGGGSAAAGGFAGPVGTLQTNIGLNTFGFIQSVITPLGGGGGAQTGAVGASAPWVWSTCGGAGGGGTTSTDFAGGNITGAGWSPTLNGGAAGSNRGADGYFSQRPFAASGGAGGGANITAFVMGRTFCNSLQTK